ncbi:CCR4-NOT transcription complex subunit 3 [Dendrobium catenatum]|uniref:Putative NOT transcription complex subunit VIP2 n=1 Tax=Dendrobium catenatum TaxID=906689 RepID=A0A2I0VEX5_9ASPA|nr:CCR4-NOT transcription complex subunit 3 [Dendrobium catenatum]PKU61971.1 putative NOT transcription complex subunit VIP2 [Dendrobium catenatum]
MGASRKLQGEIDRVLKKVQEGVDVFDSIWNKVYDTENANQKEKFEADLKKEIKKLQRYRDQIKTWIQSSEIKDKKVSASYEQALMDARKLIEREMERFKVCEKETKTKAFSKEGLGQQPKTDPREKAKAETRDWLNNVVGDLESQIDNFEAEIEGLSVKKGKARPPRLAHLETSIARHKAHIMKLELILRLLDNDELSPEQVNDVRDFIEDYVERNQEDPDEFSDVDELYSSLPLDKVESLEELVSHGPSSLVKGVGSVSTIKNSINSAQDQSEETASQDANADSTPRTPPSKIVALGSPPTAAPSAVALGASAGSNSAATSNASVRPSVGPTATSIFSGPVRGASDSLSATTPPLVNSSVLVKEDDIISFPGRRSPAIPEIALGRGLNRVPSNQASTSTPISLSSVGISSPGALSSVSAASDMSKRTILSVDERIPSAALAQPLVSPLSSKMLLQQVSQANDGTVPIDSINLAESPIVGGRVFSPSTVSGGQWRPQSATSFQNQNEMAQLRGRPEIAPDQREKYLQRLQQVQQQGHGTLLGVPHLTGANTKQFPMQQQSPLLQQVGIGLNVQPPGLVAATSVQQQLQAPMHKQSHHILPLTGAKETDMGSAKVDELQQQTLLDDLNVEPAVSIGLDKGINDDDLKSTYAVSSSASIVDASQLPRGTDLSPGQVLQSSQSSASLGVIGRRSVSELGAIGDNLSGLAVNSGGLHDQNYNLQMLEAALRKLPQPKDSQRIKNYTPRHPTVTPASYPQTRADIFENPAFWERLGMDQSGTDTLFFAFYYQQNTYQQYLAARELKRQSWRYHRKYNTWFQRHEEPKVTTDEFEKGTYVYFDFHITDDNQQHGWCQRIKTEFTFEYNYLEDDLVL